MPRGEVTTIRVLHESGSGRVLREAINKLLTAIISILALGVLDWDIETTPIEVEFSEHLIEHKPAGYIQHLATTYRRDN